MYVISVSEISAVSFIVEWKLFASFVKLFLASWFMFHREKMLSMYLFQMSGTLLTSLLWKLRLISSTQLKRHANNLKLGHLNVNSISGFKFFDVKNMLTNNLLDILVLSETKIDDSYPDNQFYVKGFKLYPQDRTNFGDGLIIYARSDPLTKNVKNAKTTGLESITIEVRTKRNSPRFILAGLYRPPRITKEIWTFELERLIESISKLSDDYTLLGDLNCNILEPDKEPKLGRHLLNLCDVYNLKCLINKPTRITPSSETLIDVVLTSNKKKFLHAGAFNPDISDHHLVYAITRASCPKWVPKTTTRRNFKKFHAKKYNEDICFIPFHVASTFDDIDDVYWAWERLLTDVLDDHAPLVQKTIAKPKPFYFNSEVIAAIRCRNQFKRKYYVTKDPNDWEKYRQQRNRVVSLRRKAIKEHFAKQCSASTREFWSVFKPYLYSRKNQTSEFIQLAEGETIFQEQSKIADILNNHLLSGTSAPAVPDPKNHHSIFTIKTNLSPTEAFNFSSVSESVAAELLKSLNIRKATGCDLIPPRALKEGYPSLNGPICSLVNQIITRREIPSI